MVRSAQRETALAPPQRRGPSSIFGLVRRVFAEKLFKNSAFMILDLGLSAVTGFGTLTLVTHIFPVRYVGLAAAAVSAASLVTYITQFGVNYSVPRYLPTAKNRTALINTVLTAVMASTLVGSVIFLALPYARKLWPLGGLAFGVLFVATTCLQAGMTVLSTVIVADRAADKLVTIGAIPLVAQLAAPPGLSFLGPLGAFLSRVSGDFFGFATFAWLLAKRGHRFRPQIDIAATRDVIKFSAGMYVANIIGGMPSLLLPLVVLSRVGPQQSAYWSIAMSIGSLIFSLPGSITQALLPEVSSRPAERRALLLRSSYLIMAMVVPALVIAYIFAPLALDIFGHSYSSGAIAPLRWLIVAGFITMLNYVTGAILFLAKKSMMVTIVNLVDAIVVLGLVMLWATNVTQIAIAWMIGDVGNTVLFGFFAFLAVREVGGRFEELGGDEAAAAVDAAVPAELTATSQQRALGVLATLAEQQRAVDSRFRPYRPSLTDSQGLFTIAALHAAERQRERILRSTAMNPIADPKPATAGPRTARPGPDRLARRASEDVEHQRAFDLLFRLSELQRSQPDSPDDYPERPRRASRRPEE